MWAGRLKKTVDLLVKGLDLTLTRTRVISSNVANAETPGYKAMDLDFQKILSEAEGGAFTVAPVKTDPRHISMSAPSASVPLALNKDEMEPRPDGNTVNLEGEMAKMAENNLKFQALTQAFNRLFSLLKEAVTEGGRR